MSNTRKSLLDKGDRALIALDVCLRITGGSGAEGEVWDRLIKLVLDGSSANDEIARLATSLGASRAEDSASIESLVVDFSVARSALEDRIAQTDFDSAGQRVFWIEARGNLDRAVAAAVSGYAALWLSRARRDAVTGLDDRAAFESALNDEIERANRYSHSFSLILFDIDDFKSINDRFGHIEGDRALAEVAGAITSTLRRSDRVFRFGGDEFAAICFGESTGGVQSAISRIGSALKEVGISSGVAVFPADASDSTSLVQVADRRLYQCKRSRRDKE